MRLGANMTMTTAQVLYIGYLKELLKKAQSEQERVEILALIKEIEE